MQQKQERVACDCYVSMPYSAGQTSQGTTASRRAGPSVEYSVIAEPLPLPSSIDGPVTREAGTSWIVALACR